MQKHTRTGPDLNYTLTSLPLTTGHSGGMNNRNKKRYTKSRNVKQSDTKAEVKCECVRVMKYTENPMTCSSTDKSNKEKECFEVFASALWHRAARLTINPIRFVQNFLRPTPCITSTASPAPPDTSSSFITMMIYHDTPSSFPTSVCH